MFETELPILTGTQPPLRCAVSCRYSTARPLAGGKLRTQAAVVFGFDPNPIEQWRMGSHHQIMRAYGVEVQDLTVGKSARRGRTPNILLLRNRHHSRHEAWRWECRT